MPTQFSSTVLCVPRFWLYLTRNLPDFCRGSNFFFSSLFCSFLSLGTFSTRDTIGFRPDEATGFECTGLEDLLATRTHNHADRECLPVETITASCFGQNFQISSKLW